MSNDNPTAKASDLTLGSCAELHVMVEDTDTSPVNLDIRERGRHFKFVPDKKMLVILKVAPDKDGGRGSIMIILKSEE